MWPKGLTNKGAGTAASCHCHQLRGQVDGDQAPTHSPQHVQRWDVQAWVGQHAREGSPKSPDRHVAQKQVNDACSTVAQRQGLLGMPVHVQAPARAVLGCAPLACHFVSNTLSDKASWLKVASHR